MKDVLIYYDVPGWAQHRHALGLQRHAPPEYRVHIEELRRWREMREHEYEQYDAIYHLYLASAGWKVGVRRLVTLAASHAWMHDKLVDSDWRTNGVTKIRNAATAREVLPHVDGVVCRNRALRDWCVRVNDNAVCIPVGIDLDVFRYREPEQSRKLRVGFCAQPSGIRPFKGWAEIVRPLMQRTSDEFEWVLNSRDQTNPIKLGSMPHWYSRIDVLVSASSAEGTPNPPFEAAACGVPVVATDVGALTDWRAMRDLQLLVPTYRNKASAEVTIEGMLALLRSLKDIGWRQMCGQMLRRSIESDYDYVKIAARTLRFIAGDS